MTEKEFIDLIDDALSNATISSSGFPEEDLLEEELKKVYKRWSSAPQMIHMPESELKEYLRLSKIKEDNENKSND